MDWQKHFNELDAQGFTVVPQVVSDKALLKGLEQKIDEALVEDMKLYGGLPNKQEELVLDLVTKGDCFLRLFENERMHKMFSHFLGDTCVLYSSTSTIMKPNSFQSTCEIHRDIKRNIPGYHLGLLMSLAISEFTDENGATKVLPHSYDLDEKPSDDYFYTNAVSTARKAGDALFMNPNIWHAGMVNNTDEIRYAMSVYSVRSWMRQKFDYPRLIPPEIEAKLSPKHRSFFGYNVRIPSNLYEYYVPEEKRLYKANQG